MSENKTCTFRLSENDIKILDDMRTALKVTKSQFLSYLIQKEAGLIIKTKDEGGQSYSAERQ